MAQIPHTAMVLAAGLGTRMRPLTDHLPKPLIKVAGKPLIDWTLDRFAGAGVRRAVVNVHYRADQMEAHLRGRRSPEIVISDERALLLETGGGLKKAAAHLGADPVYCTNTDAILVDGAPAARSDRARQRL
jgi:N-acetyl-alpha-D-muramate 1-phosphate uridylyltransferase